MAGWIYVGMLLAALAAWLVVPFVTGLVQGPGQPQPSPSPSPSTSPGGTMWPLSRLAGIYGRFLALYAVAASAVFLTARTHSVCAITPYSASAPARGYGPLRGATVQAAGPVQACTTHPGTGQTILYLLTRLPGPMLLAGVLLLIWSLVRQARSRGPFTARTALTMMRLGLLILAGGAIAGAIARLGNDLLAETLMTQPGFTGGAIAFDVLIAGPLKALLPVPALAGVALLTFARIVFAGAAMNEEIKATV
jgi:hypothetical protein